MICPMCGRPVPEKDVTWARGVAGHFECHQRLQHATRRRVLGSLILWLLGMAAGVGLVVWCFREIVPK